MEQYDHTDALSAPVGGSLTPWMQFFARDWMERGDALARLGATIASHGPNVHYYHAHPELARIVLTASADGRHIHARTNLRGGDRESWSAIERTCRGAIFDSGTGEVAAVPVPKFFPLDRLTPDHAAAMRRLPLWDVTAKLDGHHVLCWHDAGMGHWRFTDRAGWYANSWFGIGRYLPDRFVKHGHPAIPERWTLELSLDEDARPTLIAITDNDVGIELPRAQLWVVGDALGIEVVDGLSPEPGATIDTIQLKPIDGWPEAVIRCIDGSRALVAAGW